MDVDVSLPVTDENVNTTDRVTYNWTPSEPLSEAKAAWITVMQVLNEAKTSTEYQRKLINVINSRILSRIDQSTNTKFALKPQLLINSTIVPFANETFQSPDTYRRMVQGSTSTTAKHDICPNGCYLFGSDGSPTMACPVLAVAREDIERDPTMPIPDLAPTRQISYTSVDKALTELYVNENNAEMLAYRDEFFDRNQDKINIYRGIFSGDSYKKLLHDGIVDANTICLVLFVDRYQLKNMQEAHQVLINCLVMNIHPERRTKDENMIQITVCPGKSKKLDLFLKPVVEEVQAMYDNKLVIKKEGVELFCGRVAILGVTGDIPDISELMMAAHCGVPGLQIHIK
ncbi:hypothetical protein A0J61_10679 [Choanephora cucurbitarum]|uniref:Uncharacterized protein n=1 Tax=Choanephora cucurbitarum TaxID=101091 RepID=A0A1C7MWT2_9FUNG|nr:hypothetical protein A0J61_10679 [Choanephora cucurbitarum]